MTDKETIEILQELWRYKETDKYTESEIRLALDIAIQTLKNQPRFILHSDGKIEQIIEPCDDLLDKIRAKIEQVAKEEREHDRKWAQGLKYALTIIDKQKIESEANNG